MWLFKQSLRWRHNDHAGVSNHQPHGCLLNRLFRRKSKKTSKLRVTGLCAGNSPGTGEFPAQMASYAENVSIWWRHHDSCKISYVWKFQYTGDREQTMGYKMHLLAPPYMSRSGPSEICPPRISMERSRTVRFFLGLISKQVLCGYYR